MVTSHDFSSSNPGVSSPSRSRLGRHAVEALVSLLCLMPVGCGGKSSGEGGAGGFDFTGPEGGSGGANATGGTTGGTTTSDPNGDCAPELQLVYAISDDGFLYSFRPDQKLFTKIGPVACPGNGYPLSMTVDREGFAWVNYVAYDANGNPTQGRIYKVSLQDASCTAAPGGDLPSPWMAGGIGFADTKGNAKDKSLYFSGFQVGFSPGLARIDTATGQLSGVGQYDAGLAGEPALLNGTGDGRLFGFFGRASNPQIAEIDPLTAKISHQVAVPIGYPFLFDFSFWGGDFYIYTLPDPQSLPNATTTISVYRTSTGKFEQYMLGIGFIIDCVGVSTCEPLTSH